MVTVGGEAKGVEGEFCFRLWERPLHFFVLPSGQCPHHDHTSYFEPDFGQVCNDETAWLVEL